MTPVQRAARAPKNVTLSIFETFATTLFFMAITFVISVATARTLGPEGRGYVNMLATWLPVLGTVASCGMGRTFVYFSKVDSARFTRYRARLLMVVAGAVVPVALLAGFRADKLYPNLPRTELTSFQWLTGLSVPVYAMGYALTQAAQFRSDMRVFNLSRIAQPLFLFAGLIAAILFGIADYRVFAMIATAAVVLGALIVCIALFRVARPDETAHALRAPSVGSYVRYAGSSYTTDVMGTIGSNLDKVFIIVFLSARDMGIYAVAFALSRIISQIQSTVGEAVFSMNIGSSTGDVGIRVAKLFRESLVISAICGIAAAIVAPPLIPLIFGEAFAPAGPIFAILVVEAVLTGASGMLGQFFNIIGRPHIVVARWVLSTFVAAMLMYPGVQMLGSIGVASAAMLAAGVQLAASIIVYRSITRFEMSEFIPTPRDVKSMFANIKTKLSGTPK
jgi:O-antigen/teichoic acid export membrane protein